MAFVITKETRKQYLQEGFKLAYYIVLDKEKAIEIARKSIRSLRKTWLDQEKRKYYREATKYERIKAAIIEFFDDNIVRENKTDFSQAQLFQLLIYYNCGKYISIAKASTYNALTFYLMYIVTEALKNNSFYATLLNYNILYGYSKDQTMEIYAVIDPDRYEAKRPYHYDRAKKTLERRISKKTNDFIEQNNFVTNPSFYTEMVKKTLVELNLWNQKAVGKPVQCVVPKDFSKKHNEILAFYSTDLDQKEKEYNRLHGLLDPDCHNRLVTGLKYPPSEEKLLVRNFKNIESNNGFDNNGKDNPMEKRNNPSKLSDKELEQILTELDRDEEEAKGVSIGSLSIIVDGTTEREINLAKKQECSLRISEDAELIEVWANKEDNPVLLASHFLTYESFEKKKRFIFPINDSHNISLTITPLPFSEEKDDEAFFDIKIAYQDKNKFYSLNLLVEGLKSPEFPQIPRWVLVSAISITSIIVISMIWKFSTYENLKLQSQVDSLQKQNAIFLEKEKVLQSQLENLQEERLLLLEREKIVQNQLNDQLAENQILQKRLSDTKINPKKENLENDLLAVLKVDVELEVPGSRSINSSTNTSEAKQIAIAKTDKYIEFTLDLSKIAYDKYIPRSIKILRYGEIENEVISEIKSIEILEKGKYIKVKAKTYKLKKGQYKLSLVGKGEESPKEEMGEYAFSIVRK